MHLKAIKLRGFKSFVEPVEIRLEPGVAVVVGPNGSGKSNVSDSILWATGSMSPGELRAEKPDDVLFAGSAGRQPVDHAEVELIFDNADGAWPDLSFSEVSIARRLHRGGEGQYLVNRAAVRRLDLVELLSDVGLGGGLRSVISQGRVETVLNSKPAERRELIEEAAGLSRFFTSSSRSRARSTCWATRASLSSARWRRRLNRPRPAASSTSARRSSALDVRIASTLPWLTIEPAPCPSPASASSSTRSSRRTCAPLTRYWPSPPRCRRRTIDTSAKSIPGSP